MRAFTVPTTTAPAQQLPHHLQLGLRWVIYPLGWLIVISYFTAAYAGYVEWNTAWLLCNATLLVGLITLETLFPLQRRWGATWSSFVTDLQYIVMNGAFLGLVKAGLGLYAISLAGNSIGPATSWPLWLQLISAVLIFEAIQYSIHRAMHEGNSKLNHFLWRLHSSHHLPQKLYVTMHAVGHPLNGLLIQTSAMVLPIWWMGYTEVACTAFLMLNSLHGLIAHFNVDVRMGWMNYIFVGTELHRHHHSSALKEAKNFGALTSIYDQLFGTFVYQPGRPPLELGAANHERYPNYQDLGDTLAFPFLSFPGQVTAQAGDLTRQRTAIKPTNKAPQRTDAE